MVGPAVLAGPTALGQRLAHRPCGLAVPVGNGLVEQLHDLVKHDDGRLNWQQEQNRVPALRLAALHPCL
jgi:hypothetical protein